MMFLAGMRTRTAARCRRERPWLSGRGQRARTACVPAAAARPLPRSWRSPGPGVRDGEIGGLARPGRPGRHCRCHREQRRGPVLRRISASRVRSCTPPASQPSRRHPAGTSGASAQTASIQSRRTAGTIRSAMRRTALTARPRAFMAPLATPHPAVPAVSAVLAGPPAQPHQARRGGPPVSGQPVQVPPWPAWLRLVLPARLHQPPVSQPDQDRIQRARLQAGLLGQRVAVPPLRRLVTSAASTASVCAENRNVLPQQATLHR